MRREDVEALRARMLRDANNTAKHGVKLADMTFSVEGDTLDALCCAWLALDGAPVRMVGDGISYGVSVSGTGIANGSRVRIVPVDGGKAGQEANA